MTNERIENILDFFEFERVKRVMEALDWHWSGAADGVPSIAEMRKCARRLLEDLEKYPDYDNIATGGFVASRITPEIYKLSFIVESVREDEV